MSAFFSATTVTEIWFTLGAKTTRFKSCPVQLS